MLTARSIRSAPPTSQDRLRIGLVQINNSFSGQNYFPYSVGILQAYAQRHLRNPSAYDFQLPLYKRQPVPEAVRQLRDAEAIFVSAYVWNIRISLAIARQVKSLRPEVLVVFGGPQVPNRVEAFLRDNPFIDVACHGEGEQIFLKILEEGVVGNWEAIPGISYIEPDGTLVTQPALPRLKDLSSVPSPYLEGVFDPLMRANPQEEWLVMWETNRGCPFSCTFCDWGSAIASKVYPFALDRLYREIDWFADHRIEFIFCCDANFGILPRDLDIAEYAARTKKLRGYPRALSVQNTKNAPERAYRVQKALADSGLSKGVTLTFQSVDPMTLQSIKRRNISLESFQELQRRFTADGIETYSDIILGLPEETYDSFANGISTLIENGQHNRMLFNNLAILPNAEMGDPEYIRRYGMETVSSKVVNSHGGLEENEWDIPELQDLVIATKAMPRADWVRTRAFCWTVALLHFDKLLQIPLVLVHETTRARYRQLIELFTESSLDAYPTLSQVREFFRARAIDIQEGKPEFCRSEKWLNMWWPADEYMFIKLTVEEQLDSFFDEAEFLLGQFLRSRGQADRQDALADAIALNRSLLKMPFQTSDLFLELNHNIWEFYKGAIQGKEVPLVRRPTCYHIDRTSQVWHSWEDWYREVVWYGTKKGAYLYPNQVAHREIAGHH